MSLDWWLASLQVVEVMASVIWAASLLLALWTVFSAILCLALLRRAATKMPTTQVNRLVMPALRPVLRRAIAVTLASSAIVGAVPGRGLAEAPAVAVRPTLAPPTGPAWDLPTTADASAPPAAAAADPSTGSPDISTAPPPSAEGAPAVRSASGRDSWESITTPVRSFSHPAPSADEHPDAPGSEAGSKTLDEPGAEETLATHVVQVGDNLWVIARDQVRTSGRRLSTGEVAAYWLRLIEANQDGLRSGDPDLLFPGELLVLPPIGPESP